MAAREKKGRPSKVGKKQKPLVISSNEVLGCEDPERSGWRMRPISEGHTQPGEEVVSHENSEAPITKGSSSAPIAHSSTDRLLTAKQVAEMLGIPPKAVYELDISLVPISPRRYRWWLSEVIRFLEERRKC
jgi:predicted DNA-binding transcriptional regulator AlpA